MQKGKSSVVTPVTTENSLPQEWQRYSKSAGLPLTEATGNTGEKKDMLIFLGTAGARVWK